MAPQGNEAQAIWASANFVNEGDEEVDFDAEEIDDPKPKPSLSSYNMFFKLERKRILNNTDHLGLPLTNQEIRAVIAEHKVQAKRAHRKSHGKIGFKELARTIAQRWKKLDPAAKSLLEKHALVEKEEHRKIFKEWKKRQKEREARKEAHNAARASVEAEQQPAYAPSFMTTGQAVSQHNPINMIAMGNNQGNTDPNSRLDTLRQAHDRVEHEMRLLLAQATQQQQQMNSQPVQPQAVPKTPSYGGQQPQQQGVPPQMIHQGISQQMNQQGYQQYPNAVQQQPNFQSMSSPQQQQLGNMPFYGQVNPQENFSRNFFDSDHQEHQYGTMPNLPQQQSQHQEPPTGQQVSPQARFLANALSQLFQPGQQQD